MITSRSVACFLVSKMVSRLLHQLQIFWQLYLIELLGLSIDLQLLKLWHLIKPGLSKVFWISVFFTISSCMEFQVKYSALLLLYQVIDAFEWFLMEFLKAPFLVLHFSYYTIMTFLMIFSVILLNMMLMLLSTISVIKHLIWGNN